MGLIALVIAVLGTIFCCIEGSRAWGAGAAVGIAIGGFVLTLFIPFGVYVAAVGSIVLFQRARTARLAKTVAELDDAVPANILAGEGGPSDDPFTAPRADG